MSGIEIKLKNKVRRSSSRLVEDSVTKQIVGIFSWYIVLDLLVEVIKYG